MGKRLLIIIWLCALQSCVFAFSVGLYGSYNSAYNLIYNNFNKTSHGYGWLALANINVDFVDYFIMSGQLNVSSLDITYSDATESYSTKSKKSLIPIIIGFRSEISAVRLYCGLGAYIARDDYTFKYSDRQLRDNRTLVYGGLCVGIGYELFYNKRFPGIEFSALGHELVNFQKNGNKLVMPVITLQAGLIIKI